MKEPQKALLTLLGILCLLSELMELLLLPVIFLLLGLWQQFPWQYYAITIGGYFGVFLLLDGIMRFVFKLIGKKYSTRFTRKLEKILSIFSKGSENSSNLPAERN